MLKEPNIQNMKGTFWQIGIHGESWRGIESSVGDESCLSQCSTAVKGQDERRNSWKENHLIGAGL